jgi:glycosyltransferase involved in cell wall biosynthesis
MVSEHNQGIPRILYVSPHLSTGGLPQYLWKKIESFNDVAEVYCVEYSYLGDAYVVQRNKISNLLGERFIPIFNDANRLLEIISDINPDIVHFEEFCESFVDDAVLQKIFSDDRKYLICETCHSSVTSVQSKIYRPDRFVMVSKWIDQKFSNLGVPSEILEYPIEDLIPNKSKTMELLGMDPNYKHIVNIGLFTPGKNQGEIFEYANETLKRDLPIRYHFIGNTADNFKDYWGPLLENKPDNCYIWGERNDVDLFYQAADLFLFTSNFELNPLSIKEALSWKIPSVFKRLDTYLDTYDDMENVFYITNNRESNLSLILNILNPEWK